MNQHIHVYLYFDTIFEFKHHINSAAQYFTTISRHNRCFKRSFMQQHCVDSIAHAVLRFDDLKRNTVFTVNQS